MKKRFKEKSLNRFSFKMLKQSLAALGNIGVCGVKITGIPRVGYIPRMHE